MNSIYFIPVLCAFIRTQAARCDLQPTSFGNCCTLYPYGKECCGLSLFNENPERGMEDCNSAELNQYILMLIRKGETTAKQVIRHRKKTAEMIRQNFKDLKARAENIKAENRKAKEQRKRKFLDDQRAAFDERRAPEILAHLTKKMGLRPEGVECFREADVPNELNGSTVSFAVTGEMIGSWYAIATGALKPSQQSIIDSKRFLVEIDDGTTTTSDYGRFTGKAWMLQNFDDSGDSVTISDLSMHYTGDELAFFYCHTTT
jgi:vacuolar-type H+-ATPase subunit H